ncbi:MAG: GLPGLI family protein [Cytophagales bacterium]|nr:MAG: GLPGLI family protein [Cytophagales bacterium]TAF62355.1 MAG: GLPGLI family protein [Cytophagales bacterium]
MRYSVFVCLFFLGIVATVCAQTSGRVRYQYVQNTYHDKKKCPLPSIRYYNLYFKGSQTAFRSEDSAWVAHVPESGIQEAKPIKARECTILLQTELKSNVLIHTEFNVKFGVQTSEPLPKQAWQIGNESRQIGSFVCQKATTEFRGRQYTAWFAPAIPLPFGPWKLNGLPGLILEAYDENREVQYLFAEIESPFEVKNEHLEHDINKKALQFGFKELPFEEYKDHSLHFFDYYATNSLIESIAASDPRFKDSSVQVGYLDTEAPVELVFE